MAVDESDPLPDQPTVIPDALGTVSGWRAWRWNQDTLRLEPMIIHVPGCWDPDKEVSRARCAVYDMLNLVQPSFQHPVPNDDCDCGIYATKKPTAAYGVVRRGTVVGPFDWNIRIGRRTVGLEDDDVVLGRVQMWGRTIEYRKGYRAEFARITDVVGDSPAARAAAARYNVPLADPRTTARWYHFLTVWVLAFLMLFSLSANVVQFAFGPSVGNGFDIAIYAFYILLWTKVGLLPPRLRYYVPHRSGVHHDNG